LREALIISVIFHAVIIISGIVGLPLFNRERPTGLKVIPVEMVKIANVTRLKAQEKKPDQVARKKGLSRKKALKRQVEMPPPPPQLASDMPLPTMKAKPDFKQKPTKAVRTAINRIPKITPKNKPRRFNVGKLAALLDKRAASKPDIIKRLTNKKFGNEKVISMVDVRQQSLTIANAVNKYIYDNNCWNVPAGAKGAAGLRVTIHIRLDPEGKLIGLPKVVGSKRMNLPGQEFFRTAAESALRAVLKCAPYNFLPRDQYSLWRDMEIIFDPEYMLNG